MRENIFLSSDKCLLACLLADKARFWMECRERPLRRKKNNIIARQLRHHVFESEPLHFTTTLLVPVAHCFLFVN